MESILLALVADLHTIKTGDIIQTHDVYSYIHNKTDQKNISEELHRTFNSYLGVLYAASTPAINIDTASVLLYSNGFKEAKPNHVINRISFEVMMQYFDNDFFKVWMKQYRPKKNYDPESDIIRYMKAKFLEWGPTIK